MQKNEINEIIKENIKEIENIGGEITNIKKEEIEKQPQEYMQSLVEYLLGWLINHILYTDKKIPT